MLLQVRTAAAVRDLPGAVRTVRGGGALMLLSCAVFAASALDAPLWALFLGTGAAMGPAVRWAEHSRPTAPAMASVRPSGPPSTAR